MTNLKSDRRVIRTQELLLDALVVLLMERGYEKLTIQNLLDKAGVGRATFYAHFQSKEDLLSQSIGRLRSALTVQWRSANSNFKEIKQLGFTLPFFQHLESHRRIYHATIGRESEWTVEQHMQRMLKGLVREDLGRLHKGQANAAALDLAVHYVVGSLWAIVVWWMECKHPVSHEEIEDIFQRSTFPGLHVIFENSNVLNQPWSKKEGSSGSGSFQRNAN